MPLDLRWCFISKNWKYHPNWKYRKLRTCRIHLTHQASPLRRANFKCLRSLHGIQKILAIRSLGRFSWWPCVWQGAEAPSAAQPHEGGGHHVASPGKEQTQSSQYGIYWMHYHFCIILKSKDCHQAIRMRAPSAQCHGHGSRPPPEGWDVHGLQSPFERFTSVILGFGDYRWNCPHFDIRVKNCLVF